MIMKKLEALKLNSILETIKKLGSTKFKYNVLLNIAVLNPIITPINQIENDNKALLSEFETDRNSLIIKIGKKGEGDTVSIDITDEDMLKTFNEGLKEIAEEHKESLEKYEVEYKQYIEILQQEVEDKIEFKTISIDICPENGIDDEQLEVLLKHKVIN